MRIIQKALHKCKNYKINKDTNNYMTLHNNKCEFFCEGCGDCLTHFWEDECAYGYDHNKQLENYMKQKEENIVKNNTNLWKSMESAPENKYIWLLSKNNTIYFGIYIKNKWLPNTHTGEYYTIQEWKAWTELIKPLPPSEDSEI